MHFSLALAIRAIALLSSHLVVAVLNCTFYGDYEINATRDATQTLDARNKKKETRINELQTETRKETATTKSHCDDSNAKQCLAERTAKMATKNVRTHKRKNFVFSRTMANGSTNNDLHYKLHVHIKFVTSTYLLIARTQYIWTIRFVWRRTWRSYDRCNRRLNLNWEHAVATADRRQRRRESKDNWLWAFFFFFFTIHSLSFLFWFCFHTVRDP